MNHIYKLLSFVKTNLQYLMLATIVLGISNIYFGGGFNINISMALVLSTFPLEQASMMMLLLIISYLIQVPSLAFFAQNIGRKLILENARHTA